MFLVLVIVCVSLSPSETNERHEAPPEAHGSNGTPGSRYVQLGQGGSDHLSGPQWSKRIVVRLGTRAGRG